MNIPSHKGIYLHLHSDLAKEWSDISAGKAFQAAVSAAFAEYASKPNISGEKISGAREMIDLLASISLQTQKPQVPSTPHLNTPSR